MAPGFRAKLVDFPKHERSLAYESIVKVRYALTTRIADKTHKYILDKCTEPPSYYNSAYHDCIAILALIYPLPPDTDLSLPLPLESIQQTIAPTTSTTPTSSNLTPPPNQSVPPAPAPSATKQGTTSLKDTPSAFYVVQRTYRDKITPAMHSSIPQSKSLVTQSLLRLPARNTLRHNPKYASSRKGFKGSLQLNINAALLQASGTRKSHRAKCQNCTEGKGFWDSCVVASWDMEYDLQGACANCYYNGKAIRCTFHHGQC
ncbi:hypothetical protein F4820DRAFT_433980 [Hypoxylon rubiginosum]|uniref:Uncharacterized protein n=1 Tax=Hypoxylon rubiginosum TaxID=110542 RepID=A0ACB9YQ42_9PEZI|nr:hypothetical protein F4820DRAFT_433980 [Hypoxylon rubiginosum]